MKFTAAFLTSFLLASSAWAACPSGLLEALQNQSVLEISSISCRQSTANQYAVTVRYNNPGGIQQDRLVVIVDSEGNFSWQ